VSHTRPDGSGPRSRAAAYGYPSAYVGENIYIGGMATADSAWTFWINSGIHYAGLVNPNYNEVGIGVATANGNTAFVLDFGNSGGPSFAAVSASAASGGGAAPGLPSYVVGSDEHGNIMHEVQQGDTLGDIALIYGYTWADLPAMMALNGLTDVRDLEVGSVFLVPPKAGTYTPTPATPTPSLTPSPIPPTLTPYVALLPVNAATLQVTPLAALTQAATPTATMPGIATAAGVPAWLEDGTASPTPTTTETPVDLNAAVALLPTPAELPAAMLPPAPENNTNTLLIVAILVQVGVIGAAAFSFLRGGRKGR
ncbi:MAG TPA: LysM peptidoglycan-binding domain-containing protein, partial [Candidatus Limnocylindrales bacterium]|nr:LysM peptidoglycan-binding domain-containing protein [Candidatus Limnocylindrales bacterium]